MVARPGSCAAWSVAERIHDAPRLTGRSRTGRALSRVTGGDGVRRRRRETRSPPRLIPAGSEVCARGPIRRQSGAAQQPPHRVMDHTCGLQITDGEEPRQVRRKLGCEGSARGQGHRRGRDQRRRHIGGRDVGSESEQRTGGVGLVPNFVPSGRPLTHHLRSRIAVFLSISRWCEEEDLNLHGSYPTGT
jgi:hypothetical protein